MPSPSQKWGFEKEAVAEEALVRRGYTIVARNWRGGGGEIDRIAWNEGVLCFVEVRARSSASFGLPADTVRWNKQRKLVRAAAMYLARFSPGTRPIVRFDVVSIVASRGQVQELEVIKDAFAGW
jgi:putative endonuclease